MKLGAIACALLLFTFPAARASQGFQIISTESRVWGNWLESDQSGPLSSDTFSFTSMSASGITTNVRSTPAGFSQAEVSVNPFGLNMQVHSAPWYESTHGSGIDIFAQSVTRFTPMDTNLELNIGGFAQFNYSGNEQDMQFTLQDLTASATLFDLKADSDWSPWLSDTAQFLFNTPVDPTHDYEFALYAWVDAWDAKNASLSCAVNIAVAPEIVVPEPGSASFLLLASGLLLLRSSRRGAKLNTSQRST